MLERLDRYWRVVATGLAFTTFGLGGLLLRVLAFPVLRLALREQQFQTLVARKMIRVTFRAFVGLLYVLGILRYEVRGLERLERNGLLVLANHPTLLDTVFLMALVKHANCIVKSGLQNNPFTRGPVRAAGYISNESGPQVVDDCIASLKNGHNLIIFPEGTRTGFDGVLHFKRGAANIAVRGVQNVTPVTIRCIPPSLRKGEPWWQVPVRRMQFTLEVHDDIDVRPFIANCDNEALAARHLTDYLQDYFSKESQGHAVA